MKILRHKHHFEYGQTWVLTFSGDVEFYKDRCCLDQNCSKYQIWFSKRWRDALPLSPILREPNETAYIRYERKQ